VGILLFNFTSSYKLFVTQILFPGIKPSRLNNKLQQIKGSYMNSIKRISFVLLFILLSSNAFAQRSSGWAMVFTWDRFNADEFPVSTLKMGNDIQGIGGIGLEYKLSYQWSLLAGLAYGSQSETDETVPGSKDEESTSMFGFTLGPVFYLRGYDVTGIRPYLGARISYGRYGFSSESSTTTGTTSVNTTVEGSTSSLGFALFGGADVEIISGVRAGAGYGLGYSSFPESESERTVTTPGSSTTTTTKGPSSSQFTTFFHMTLKLLF
jgi:opacity protein-like surface antigen